MSQSVTPNLFSHARSELAQDAVLAFLLEWAKPEFTGPLHELGLDLLKSLLKAVADQGGKPVGKMHAGPLKITSQDKQVDVLVQLSDREFLIIEDKTETKDHGDQILRYKNQLEDDYNDHPDSAVHTVYLKTGNESRRPLPNGADAFFFRHDLLAVLNRHIETRNDIVDDFRAHLQKWEDQTNAFLELPPEDWAQDTWRPWEGFFGWLQEELELNESEPVWDYVHNAQGGFLGFWWNWLPAGNLPYELYLQIHHVHPGNARSGPGLFIRAYGKEGDDGKTIPVRSAQMWSLFETLESCMEKFPDPGFHLGKAGSFRGGKSAGIAELTFDENNTSFLATDWRGNLDKPATIDRIRRAEKFLSLATTRIV